MGLAGLGLVIPPKPFRHPVPSKTDGTAPLQPDLPEPVRRHFENAAGNPAPVIESAVVWGRARVQVRGLWMPIRFKAWYRPGDSFYKIMEFTWFRRPILRGSDYFREGVGCFEISGEEERGPTVDQRENLTMWAESLWLPAVFVHHPAARWEPVDETSARLIVPFKDGTDQLMAFFDPETGCMTHLSALRYRTGSEEKKHWRVDLLEWKRFEGLLLPCRIAVTWGETVSPWAYWNVDGVAYNVSVNEKLG